MATMKSQINTFNITYDPYDNLHIVVCPECGDCVEVKNTPYLKLCKCGYNWKVKKIAIGKLVKE